MSNEQTVRDILHQTRSQPEVATWLGIDPDMMVTELQRRLKIAERALSDPQLGAMLDWLTREDDQ